MSTPSRFARLVLCLAGVVLVAHARADVLVHKDGRRIEGTVISEADGKIRFRATFGELEFPRADVVRIEKGKTRQQELADRESACKTAEDYYQLGLWAKEQKLAGDAKRCMAKAIELDKKHAGAHQFFGHVEYKGDWMTPEERDQRQKADLEADMLARGLVRFQDRWVTPDEKAHLEKNEVLVDGAWIPFADAQRKRGLEEFDGTWLPRSEAIARGHAKDVEALAKIPMQKLITPDALLCGPQSQERLEEIGAGLTKGRAWFDATFQSKPGLELFGGRLAEFYMFQSNPPYLDTIAHFGSLTKSVGGNWAESVQNSHGFLWWDPYPLSSVRQWARGYDDVVGHDYHHWGHLLLNRLGYDGRLLPPWYDEGVAALLEYRTHQHNSVFCRALRSPPPPGPSTGGTPPRKGETKGSRGSASSTTKVAPLDPKAMREGKWRDALVAGMSELPPFDQLASREFNELESADIAASMAIVEWIESRGEGALRRFHDVLRKTAEPAPVRVLPNAILRERVYQEAFQSAVGMGWKEADAAWRQWITTR